MADQMPPVPQEQVTLVDLVGSILPPQETNLLFAAMLLNAGSAHQVVTRQLAASPFLGAVFEFLIGQQGRPGKTPGARQAEDDWGSTRYQAANDRRATIREVYKVIRQEAWFGEFGDREREFFRQFRDLRSRQTPLDKWRQFFQSHSVYNQRLGSALGRVIWTALEASALYLKFNDALTSFLCGIAEGRTPAELQALSRDQILALFDANPRRFRGYGFTFHHILRRLKNYQSLALLLDFEPLSALLKRFECRFVSLDIWLRSTRRDDVVRTAAGRARHLLEQLQSELKSFVAKANTNR